MQVENSMFFRWHSLIGHSEKWLMGSWFLWIALFPKPLLMGPNILCLIETTWKSTWEINKQNMLSLIKVWNKFEFIMKIITSILGTSRSLLFDDLNLFYDKWWWYGYVICYILTHFVEWVAYGWIWSFETYVQPPKGGQYAQEALEWCLCVGKWQILSPSSFQSLKRIVKRIKYFSIAGDKVTSIANQFDGYLFTSMW